MTDYAYFLLLGAGAGAIIAALGLGLVITHQGSGVVNFALGAMATWPAYVYADLRQGAIRSRSPDSPHASTSTVMSDSPGRSSGRW